MANNVNSEDLPSNLISFVCDPVSLNVVNSTIKDMAIAYTQSAIGEISDACSCIQESRSPKILLIDLSNSELPLSDVETIKELCAPDTNIVAIGSKNDVGLFRGLLKLGVADYITKPLSMELLKKSLNRIIQGVDKREDRESRKGTVVSIIGSVGGIGSSTVSANCAWMLANKYFKRTVLMDGNFQFGTSNLLLDIKSESSYLDSLESPDKIDDYFVETIMKKHSPRLFHMGGLIDITRIIEPSPEAFDVLVETVRKQFNYIIIDLPMLITNLSKILISKTKLFIILAELSIASAHNTARILEYLKQEARDRNVIIVLNKLGMYSRGDISKDSFEQVVGMQVNHIIHFDKYTPFGAANVGQPLASLQSSINANLDEIIQDIFGNNIISNKTAEIYKDDMLSMATINKLLKKVGIGPKEPGEQ